MTTHVVTPDQDERYFAAAELDRNVVVLAGAGTGKTTLLIDRLTLLIIGREIPVEKIVALTFTKKAAEEMRERLEERLRDIINGRVQMELLEARFSSNKSKWPALAKKVLEDIPKSQIGTIHSFASHLLRLYPLQAGVDPKFQEDNGAVTETVFETMWAEWIAGELANAAPSAGAWASLLQRVQLSELREMAAALVNPMVDLASLNQAPDLAAFFTGAADQLTGLWKKFPRPAKARVFLPALEALAAIFSLLRERKPVPPDLLDRIGNVDKPPVDWAEAKPVLRELKKSAEAFAMVDELLFAQIYERLIPFVHLVRRQLAHEGAVSFDGLLVFARNLLRDHPDVREALKKRFAAFLVDEFQDTDPLQGEILFYLAEKPGRSARRWQDIELGSGRLFVVGDPKQSIYRFRGADIAAFETFEEHMIRQGAIKATLSANFRSDPRILNFVNVIFPPVMHEKKFIQPPYSSLEPGKEIAVSDSPAVKIVHVLSDDEEKLNAEERRLVEAQTIADWIESRVKKGELRYADIAVLLRSSYAFEEYLEAFRSRGICYLAEGEKSFYRTSEVVDFLNLLSVIADPEDRLALVGVLRSPVGGLSDKEIWELKNAGGLSIRKPPPVHKKKIARLFLTLHALSNEAASQPLGQAIKCVFDQTWALELASTSAHGEQAVANLFKVGRLAETWSERARLPTGGQAPMTLKDFVRRFNRYREDERDEGENPLADVKYNAVKVLTVHKAKGLEFPVVILPNLSAGQRSGDKKLLRRDWRTGFVGLRLERCDATNAAMALIERQEAERERAEEIRVFYVATTRAKSQVVCFISGQEKECGRFATIVKGAGQLPDITAEEIRQKPLAVYDFSKPMVTLSKAWNVDKLAETFKRRQEEWRKAKEARLMLSPTALLSEPEKTRIVDDETLASRETSIQIGLMCHKILEEWDFEASSRHKISLPQAIARAAALFELLPENPATHVVLAEAEQTLKRFFGSKIHKKICSAKILGREIPFIYPISKLEGLAMRGIIDLLYERDGKTVVADYKTNKLGKRSLKEIAEHYRKQGEVYQEAVRRVLKRDVAFELIFLREGVAVSL